MKTNSTTDSTESVRRDMVAEINENPKDREALEKACGQVWDSDQLRADFEVLGFLAPFVRVRRKSDRAMGLLMFQHSPRFYWVESSEGVVRRSSAGKKMTK